MTQSGSNLGFRFSLRALLVGIAFICVVLTALTYANTVWWLVVSSAAILLLMALAVVALVDRGPRRAFAVGFIACVAVYALLLRAQGIEKFGSLTQPILPTTIQLNWMYPFFIEEQFSDPASGRLVAYEPPPFAFRWGNRDGVFAFDEHGRRLRVTTVGPDRFLFVSIGHVFWAMILGLVGGRFALFVCAKGTRRREHQYRR